eukprot:gnl/TRDRNA2_/TRDRNA2_31415_c0_seq1.p1 gnl/TRDRNA2_/TRDRNA2_31415_c0~~gnl/TRDRNA2_/TRDRNA2_31415_c0_seq1.p1  ORF type:complete len:363 (-),score=25.06 gnl/TRDRNA2_/TRDRNA2_31415_c0_seq1:68-1120(-)
MLTGEYSSATRSLLLSFLLLRTSSILAQEAEICDAKSASSGCGERVVAVVTGANRGLGLEVVSGLLSRLSDADIYLTSRDADLGRVSIACLRERHFGEGSGTRCCSGFRASDQACTFESYYYEDSGRSRGNRLIYHQLDLADVESIAAFKAHIAGERGGVDILINNGAASADQPHARMIAVNNNGHRDLTFALLSLLRPMARIVNVASEAGSLDGRYGEGLRRELLDENLAETRLHDMLQDYVRLATGGLQAQRGWPLGTAYQVSKMAQVVWSRILARDLAKLAPQAIGATVNSVCPGPSNCPRCQQGAHTILHAAMFPTNSSMPRGRFYVDPAFTGIPMERALAPGLPW